MNTETWLNQAEAYEAESRWAEAAYAYEQALLLDGAKAEIYNQVGIVYEKLEQPAKAKAYYQTALRHEATFADAYYNLAQLCKAQGRLNEAKIRFQQFLNLETDSAVRAEVKDILGNLSEKPAMVCDHCYCVSSYAEAFQRVGQQKWCPGCYQKKKKSRASLFMGFEVIGLLIIVGLIYAEGGIEAYYLFINTALALLILYPLVILHELAHTGVALLGGGKLFRLQFGTTLILFQKRLGDCQIIFGLYPSGFCFVEFPTRSFIRLRYLLMIAAGPLLHVGFIVWALPGINMDNLDATYAFQEVFLQTNVLIFIINIIPWNTNIGQGMVAGTDGKKLWQLLTGKRSAEEIHTFYFLAGSRFAYAAQKYEQALDFCEQGLNEYPDNYKLKGQKGAVLIELERYSEALSLLEVLIAANNYSVDLQAINFNNAGWAALLMGNFQRAYALTSQAFAITPWISAMQGTWGGGLVEAGELEAGIHHSLQASEAHESAQNQASCLAYAAIGCARLGDLSQAQIYLNQALTLDPNAPVVAKAKQELALLNIV